MQAKHQETSKGFLVEFDNFHSTHSAENRELVEMIYQRLAANGHIARRKIVQAFDPEKQLFLADRYLRGQCPTRKAADQYGENSAACGATSSPMDLIAPVPAL